MGGGGVIRTSLKFPKYRKKHTKISFIAFG